MTWGEIAAHVVAFVVWLAGMWALSEHKRRQDERLAANIAALCREIERSWEDPRAARVKRILAGLEK